MNEKIIILDFGSQFTQLIARRLREIGIYCEIKPYNKVNSVDADTKAIILSGSPFSVLDENALMPDIQHLIGTLPIMAVCYGAQWIAKTQGGIVHKSNKREYGKANLNFEIKDDPLFEGVEDGAQVWMSHSDSVLSVPEGFEVIASTADIPVAAYRSAKGKFDNEVYCVQFHPEVTHSLQGKELLENFVKKIAGCRCDWTPASFIDMTVQDLKAQIVDEHVVLGLSGGVDSTVAASLLHKAIGDQLHCIFLDNGLLRKDEFSEVMKSYEGMGFNITGVDATSEFLDELEGISDPEEKRKTIGRVFIEVFQREAKKINNATFLGQGTIYPDVIESVSVHGPSVTIKSHHNVGGLPDLLNLKIVEPLRMLFKDEVRRVGRELGISEHLVGRHPFPGPGLAIRVLGPLDREKIRLCQEADAVYINLLREHDLYDKVWQAGAILLPVQSVGVMGDERTYEFTIALRCVNSVDGMTAEWSRLPHEFLAQVSSKIINQIKGINRVVYDISTKPPATIEWE